MNEAVDRYRFAVERLDVKVDYYEDLLDSLIFSPKAIDA